MPCRAASRPTSGRLPSPCTESFMTGIDGFLGTRGSLGMDVVLVGLFAVLPLLAWSVYLVRSRRDFAAHQAVADRDRLGPAGLHRDLRDRYPPISDWKVRARPSPFWPGGRRRPLAVHLVFAVSTLVLWVWTICRALGRFPQPPLPGTHGRASSVDGPSGERSIVLTAVTGSCFYWLAFVAS